MTAVPPPTMALPLWARLAGRLGSLSALAVVPLVLFWVVLVVLRLHTAAGVAQAAWLVAMVLGLALTLLPRRVSVPTLLVDAPVGGHWIAMNSPATRVPSHGTHGYGQTFAVDLVHDPDGGRPAFGRRPAFRLPAAFPAFGQPVHAAGDGVVVRVVDRRRDHRSRSTWPAVAYLLAEGVVRELGGVGPVLGNHVILRLADGSHLMMAHLKHASARVSTGDHVRAGDVLAACGNSGNTSEPHVHVQRMDLAHPLIAVGLPWGLRDLACTGNDEPAGTPTVALPANGQSFVGRPASAPAGPVDTSLRPA